MQIRKILTVITLFFCLSVFVSSVIGQNTETLPLITADNIEQLMPISTLESSYLGDLRWSDDGRWLALGTSHDGVQVFQADNLTLAPHIFPAGTNVLFHPNSNYLVSDGSVWDIDNQTRLYEFGEVDFQQFSPDGTLLFTAQYFNEYIEFSLWQALTGAMLNTFSVETIQDFKQVIFSEDLSRFAIRFRPYDTFATTGNSFIEVRETADATLLLSVETNYSEISTLTFANESQELVYSNVDFGIYGLSPSEAVFWDIASQTIVQSIDTNSTNPLLSPDGKWLFVPQIYQSDAYRIELDTRQVVYLTLGDRVDTNALAIQTQYSPDGSYVGIPYYEQTQDTSQQGVILWQITPVNDFQASPVMLFVESSQNAGGIRSIDFSADSSLVTVAYTQQTVIWDIASESIRRIIDEGGQTQFISGSSNYLKINNNVWDIETASLINTIIPRQNPQNSPSRLLTASLSFDSMIVNNLLTGEELILTTLDDYLGKTHLIDPENDLIIFRGEQFLAYDLLSENRLLELDISPSRFWASDDGSNIITQTRSETASTGNTDNALTIYDLETDKSIQLEDTFSQAETVAISPDKQSIFVSQRDADNNNQLFLYNPQTGSRLAQWQSNIDFITTAIFSPDSQYLLMAGRIRGEGRLEFGLFVWQVSNLLAGDTETPFSTLDLSQRDFIASAELSFTANSQDLVISLNDALMGGERINGYRVEVFNWQDILANNEDDIEHLTIESAYNPSFHPSDSLILADSSRWNGNFHDVYVTLWDSETGGLIVELDGFSHARLSPDGNLVMALSSSPTNTQQMMIWRTADLRNRTTDPILTLDAPNVTNIGFSENGNRIFQQTSYAMITLGIATED